MKWHTQRGSEPERGTEDRCRDEGVTAREQASGGPGAGVLRPGPGPLTAVTGQLELRRVLFAINSLVFVLANVATDPARSSTGHWAFVGQGTHQSNNLILKEPGVLRGRGGIWTDREP